MTNVDLERTYAPLEIGGKTSKPRLEVRNAVPERLQLLDVRVQGTLRALRMAD